MSSPTCRVFALERTPRGGAPRWLRLGDHWDGYVLVGYDRHPETLVLRRGGDTVRLVLDRGPVAGSAAVVSVAPVPPPRARAVAAAEVRRREGWVSATECAQPQRHGTQWWVLVRHAVDGRSEARMVILSADGRVLDYWRV